MLATLQSRFEQLKIQKEAVTRRFAGVETRYWTAAPGPGEWSLSEIANHLVLVEQEVIRQLRERSTFARRRRGLREHLGSAAVHIAFRYGFRVKVPLRSVVPVAGLAQDQIFEAWSAVRDELELCLEQISEDSLDDFVCRHPIAGKLNIKKTLDLIERHITHHLRQIERTEKRLGINTTGPNVI